MRTGSRNRFFIAIGFIFLFILHSIPARVVILTWNTWNDVQILQRAFASDDVPITPAARSLIRDVRAWRGELSPLISFAPQLAWAPHYGGDFAQYPHFAALMDEILDVAESALGVYEVLDNKLARDASFGAALITLAQENEWQIKDARMALERAKQTRAGIQERDLSSQAHAFLRNVDRALNEWDAALRLLQDAPTLFGNDAPRRYLVLAQNNDEIRPTGGFISAVGVLRVERGELDVEWFGDSFAVDDLSLIHPSPPAPLQKYMWASQWLLRDSNWYAHFPTSADVAQSMYVRDRHLKTDGVIAVDTRFLPRLVGAMGDVTLEGQPLAPENVIGMLKASWQPMPPGDMSATWFANDRKSFLADLMNGMLIRFRTGDVHTNALAQALWRGLREKSVQLYLNDADAQQAILDAGWGGAVQPAASDYLFVVDSNVGFNKVNARVTRDILYTVRLKEKGGDATVEITYNNPSRAAEGECDLLKQHKDNTYASMEQSCYWNYVRVLAPRASQFISADGIRDAGETEDIEAVTAFGGYTIIPRNTTQTVKVNYALTGNVIDDDTYSLKIQQQAGAAASRLTVRVELPDSYAVRGTTHPFSWRGQSILEFQDILYQDTTIKIYFHPH
jgi:hypothetical protein